MANYQSAYTGAQIDTAVSKMNNIEYSASEINEKLASLDNVLSTSMSNNGVTYNLYKYGRIGWITTVASGTTTAATSANTVTITVPDEYKPIGRVEMVNTTNAAHRICLGTDGKLELVSAIAAGSYLRLSAAYITAS